MLDEARLKQLQPLAKAYKVYDRLGLFVLVQPDGAIWWRYRYRIKGSEKGLSFGTYPAVSLIKARELRDKAIDELSRGLDPAEVRKAEKQQPAALVITASGVNVAPPKKDTFQEWGESWLRMMTAQWSLKTLRMAQDRLNTFVYPFIVEYCPNPELKPLKVSFGDIPCNEITTAQVFELLKAVEGKGIFETTHRCKDLISRVLRYARAKGLRTISVADDMRGALSIAVTNSHPALVKPDQIARLLTHIYSYRGRPVTRAALKISALCFPRPENVQEAEWTELDLDGKDSEFDGPSWVIPASKLKGLRIVKNQDLIIPLSTQAVEIFRTIRRETGDCQYVFPNDKGCVFPMSDGAVNRALKLMGYDGLQTGHGFRATARTMIEERLKYDPKYPEMQLAHKVKDSNGNAYNRTAFLEERREMMQRWADYLERLRLDFLETHRETIHGIAKTA